MSATAFLQLGWSSSRRRAVVGGAKATDRGGEPDAGCLGDRDCPSAWHQPLIALNNGRVTFKVKDYRLNGPGRHKAMTLDAAEFIRRFLIHVLPKGFHRIRHYGLFANGSRTETIARARQLLAVVAPNPDIDRRAISAGGCLRCPSDARRGQFGAGAGVRQSRGRDLHRMQDGVRQVP
jgi:hypothetical protein